MRVLIAGASGFIGAGLADRFRARGDEVYRVVRSPGSGPDAVIDVDRHTLDSSALPGGSLDGIDAVFAVGGDPLVPRRWGPAKRRSIRSSRVDLVETLARAIANASTSPPVLVTMSAVGIYGERGEEGLTENSPAGKGFVADLCRLWEQAAAPARTSGTRVVAARSGIVFGPDGGFIAKLAPIFRYGLGGRLGTGRQWMSWISREDAVTALVRFATDDTFVGPVNLTSPNPIRNRAFTKAFAHALHRPAPFIVPHALMTAATGRRVTNEFLLQSAKVIPDRLVHSGFIYTHADPDDAIRYALGGKPTS